MATSRKLSFSCRPEHWKTTKFADNKTLIKAEKYFHSFNVVHLNFVSIFLLLQVSHDYIKMGYALLSFKSQLQTFVQILFGRTLSS